MATASQNKYRELLPEKEYLKNLTATVISRFGDSIDAIAYTWMTYAISGSASLTAATYGVNTLVSVILQPFTGSLVTNWNKKAVMVSMSIGRGLLVCMTAILFFLGLLEPWMVITATAFMSTLEAFQQPAATAIFPQILPKEKYTLAMSLNGALTRTAEITGTALAGTLIAFIGIPGALLVDAVTFFVSSGILGTIKLPPIEKAESKNPWQEFLQTTGEGFHYVWSHRLALALCASACILNFAFVPLTALQTAYVNEGLKLSAQALSVTGIFLSLGMALGAALYPVLANRFKRYHLFFVGIFGLTSSYTFLAAITFLEIELLKWVFLALIALLIGIASALANTSVQVSFMEKIEANYLARVSGIMNSMCMAAMPIGSFIIAAFASSLPVVRLTFFFGVFSILIAIGLLAMKPLREL